jgi:hypothetical protein
MLYDGALNAARFITFLRRLTKDAGQKVVLIADSDEAGRAFQSEAGHLFRHEAGQGSDFMPATLRVSR